MATRIVWAKEEDVSDVLAFVRELAVYERLEAEVVASEQMLRASLFGPKKYAEVVFFEEDCKRAGFALFYHNYSTFLARPGLYLEDLFIRPEYRGKGYGKRLLSFLAKVAMDRGCGRFEWSVLDWNQPAIDFYQGLGSKPMADWTVHRVTGESLASLASLSTEVSH